MAPGSLECALRFGILSLIGTLVYAAAVSSIGYGLGSDWDRVAGDLLIAGYVIAALLVAAITAFIIFRLCALRREPAEDPRLAPDGDGAPGKRDGHHRERGRRLQRICADVRRGRAAG